MKTWIRKKIYEYVDFVKEIKSFSDSTEKTYVINLLEASKYIDIKKADDLIEIDLMPYRIFIKDRSRKTIYKKISIIRAFIKHLQKEGLKIKLKNDDNVSTKKTLPKPVKDEYIKEALKVASLEDRLLIELIYSLGLRIGEVENLKVKDIKNSWVIIKGKGGKIRQLPLLDSVEKLLNKFLDEKKPVVFLFEKDKKGLNSHQLRYRLSKVFKDIGLKVTPHQLRHSFATELLDSGANISDVSRLLGHSSLESTQIYTKLSSAKKIQNYNKSHPLAKMESDLV